MLKYIHTAGLVAAIVIPGAAFAQAAPPAPASPPATTSMAMPTVGAKVYDSEGGDVGTVEAVEGDIVTVNTGTARAGLPMRAFAMRAKGPTIAMTKVQLETAASRESDRTRADLDTAIAVGATVKGSDGITIGTISAIAGDDVTVQMSSGSSAIIKKSTLGMRDGALAVGMTAEAFAAQVLASPAGNPAE